MTLKVIRYFVLVLPTMWAVNVAASAEKSFVDANAEVIEALLDEEFAGRDFGMVIGLIDEKGSRVFGAGKLDNGTDRQVDGDTIFEIGSVTKVCTALLLQDAVRRGELQLDDPVVKYLPENVAVPLFDERESTLQNLAVQDSGLPLRPDNLSDKPLAEMSLRELKESGDAYTIDDMVAFLSSFSLSEPPGTRFQYS